MIPKQIKPYLWFSIVYEKEDGTIEKYTLRLGVKHWKDDKGRQHEVTGNGHPTKEGYMKAYCSQRKWYRQFRFDRIIVMKQGEHKIVLRPEMADQIK